MDRIPEGFVRPRILAGISHGDVSEELQSLYSSERGFSARRVFRFWHDHNIYYLSRMSDSNVDSAVADIIRQVT